MSTRYEYYDDSNVGYPTYQITGTNQFAQAFTPSIAHVLSYVRLYLTGDNHADVGTVDIYLADADGKPTGAVSGTGTFSGAFSGTQWIQVTITPNVFVLSETTYIIVVRYANTIGGQGPSWRVHQTAPPGTYRRGRFLTTSDSGLNWYHHGISRLFREYDGGGVLYENYEELTGALTNAIYTDWGGCTFPCLTSHSLKTASFYGEVSPNGSATVTAHIRLCDVHGIPTGADLGTATKVIGAGMGWQDFTFASAIPLTAGQIYALILSRTGGYYLQWKYQNWLVGPNAGQYRETESPLRSWGVWLSSVDAGVTFSGIGEIAASFEEYGDPPPDRLYVWLGTTAAPLTTELTDPDYPLVLGVRTERGRDEELGHAAAGIAEIVCDNRNGDFSPDNTAGVLTGKLKLGAIITVYHILGATIYKHFKGKIDKIVPHGEPDNLTAYILAIDGMDDLAGSEIETPLRTATGANELLDDIHDAVNWPLADRTFDASVDTLQLGWYHETKALDEIQALEETERGFYLIDVDGTALWQNRHYRVTGARLVSQYDFGEDFIELALEYSKRELRNWARVTGYRYEKDETGDYFIWYAPTNYAGAPFVPAGTTVEIWAPLAGPLYSHDVLVAGIHWNANSAYDKSGDDLSDDVTVTATDYGQAIKFTIANASAKDAYLVAPDAPPADAPEDATLLVVGFLYAEKAISVVKEDTTSRDAYGKRTISIDAKFKSNYNDILSYAEWLVQRYKDPLPSPVLGMVSAFNNYPDYNWRIKCLSLKISDRITAASTKLGIDQDFFIDKIIQDYVALEGGWVHNVTYSLSRTEGQAEGLYWLIGVAGFSELGETTRLGF